MNLSMNWLSDFVDVKDVDIKAFCDRMTDTGSKVEGYEILGKDIENVKVARIVSLEKHPDSDHLQICQMDIGTSENVQIVTGAQNVFEGAIVPAAIPVAKLPGDVTIKAGKLRGVPSNGMLCSFGELGLDAHDCPGEFADGIWILGEEYADRIGEDIRDVMMLNDAVVEFEITSNRPDCLSVIGLAREAGVSFDRPFTLPTPSVKGCGDGDKVENHLSVKIDCPDVCYRYTGRVVKNVRVAPSPMWLRRRLRAAGVRPINNIVDITNYVMLEYGQPMHAFDAACLDGSAITVRYAAQGEQFRSLDDQDHTLDASMMVIADDKKAVALAGVMGGANSEITEGTTKVVFESASFNGASVRVTAKKNGMRTESSSRFEKGLDPENAMAALQRACELVELLGAGDVVDGTIDVYPTKSDPVILPLEVERINRFLGVDLSADYMKDVLRRLDFTIEGDMVTAPSFRIDITCMNDLAEEIIRIYGYNEIPTGNMCAEATRGGRTEKQSFEVALEQVMYGMGYSQIHTFSFISPKFYDKIRMPEDSALRRSVTILNPLGEDTSVMRTTAVPSLLEVLARNNNFSNENVRLFEVASVYYPNEDDSQLPEEKKVLTVGAYGKIHFFAIKGMVENVLALAGIQKATYVSYSEDATYHPGRCAKVIAADGTELGIFGQLHPLTAANYGIDTQAFVAALDFDAIFAHRAGTVEYKPLPKFPATTRDFSFVVDEAVEVGTLITTMTRAGGKLVEGVALFDIYRGPQIGEGKKSVSLRVSLRAADRTLTVEEADKVSAKILGAMEHQLGITIRQ
ncbi:MAG: phenylalanine--tRNA ligase subunit beta [Ruminococcaceae bacterium]|nr:phenylalanine--tRNA ligase subunit beta [Oscillospiraceae bacterium]